MKSDIETLIEGFEAAELPMGLLAAAEYACRHLEHLVKTDIDPERFQPEMLTMMRNVQREAQQHVSQLMLDEVFRQTGLPQWEEEEEDHLLQSRMRQAILSDMRTLFVTELRRWAGLWSDEEAADVLAGTTLAKIHAMQGDEEA